MSQERRFKGPMSEDVRQRGQVEQRCHRLRITLEQFFDAFVPLGKLDLLRECVLHKVADDAPDRLMREEDAVRDLAGIGFGQIEIRGRENMTALLVARKDGCG